MLQTPSPSQSFLHISNDMHKNKHTHRVLWVAGILWVIGIDNPWCHTTVSVCVGMYCMLTVINYLPHAGDLLGLLITSWTKPTGGWFSCTNRESISVWGLVYLSMCTDVDVFAHACVCNCVWLWNRHRMSLNLMMIACSHCHHISQCLL